MPGQDGSGPLGRGPMTGKAAGYCVGHASTGYGRGMGRGAGVPFRGRGGYGQGCGFRAGFGASGPGRRNQSLTRSTSVPEEREWLQAEEKYLSESLQDIKNRLSKLNP
ncbi:MAG: DUF5320 domain-containing protein [Deltaproteobacteria bacterium]|nr:DUF5320 domain-containing protein [Deltaproteobacteria bacterium]MBT7715858.1 DUF5320 domain-containing protein [Deltaproteobacteria bacterium]